MASSIYLFLFIRLFFLLSLLHLILAHSPAFMQPLCHDDERSALLQFKESFIINKSASYEYPFAYGRIDCQKVASWSVEGDKSDCCSWDGVKCDEDSGYVIGLDLRSSCLYGSINSNSSLFRLVHLQRLDLSYNHFNYSPIPSQVRNLSRLTYLNLTTSMFSGQIPLEISQLSHLTSLDLGYNYDSYSEKHLLELKKPNLTSLIGNLTHLHKLCLDGVSIFSKITTILANFSSLTSLSLDYCGLHGEFPVGIFKLPNLRVLQVGMNEGLIGYLQDFTWSNPLEALVLADTSFSGELPASIGNLSHLTMLDVHSCNFSGSIPSSLGNLTNLTFLRLSFNTFKGEVPSSIFNLKNLQNLDLRMNYFSGTVEFGEFVKLKHLTILCLSHIQLSLPFKEPSANATLPKFQVLSLSSCNLSKFPDFLRNQDELEILDLSENNLHGPVPEWMLNIGKVSLESISLANNFLTGFGDQHPILLPWTRLAILDLGSNLLQGSLPIPAASTLQYYSISNNSLTGNVPELFCNLSSLRVLDLANNNLSGSLPRCLDNFGASLSVLDLGRNKFQGSISDTWVKGSQLKIIIFSQNKFEGRLTRSLVNCTMLKVLHLGNNQFNDRFPSWLENLPNLEVLILRSNKFNGPIKTSKSEYMFPNLRIIDLSNNNFVGKLPLELFSNWKVKNSETAGHLTYIQVNSTPTLITKTIRPNQISYVYDYSMTMTNKGEYMFFEKVQELFTAVDMSNNRFIGGIPNSIDNLRGCRLLNLSNNILNGHIPSSLGNIVELEALDLSQNKLSGEIPPELTQLTFLGFFNVSHNNLTGPIPQGKQFTTFEKDSFEGNLGLCGSQLTKKCENFNELPYQPSIFEESQDFGSPFEFGWKIVVIGYGFGFAVGVIIGHIVIARKYEWLMKTLRIRPLSGRRHRNLNKLVWTRYLPK